MGLERYLCFDFLHFDSDSAFGTVTKRNSDHETGIAIRVKRSCANDRRESLGRSLDLKIVPIDRSFLLTNARAIDDQ